MKPIIKWPGGKSGEFQYIKNLIPDYDRYVEPFFGGGAIMFELLPKKAIINDLSSLLMDFYRLVKEQNPLFRELLYLYDDTFKSLSICVDDNIEEIVSVYESGYAPAIDELVKTVLSHAKTDKRLMLDDNSYYRNIKKMVADKFRRTKKNNEKEAFCADDLRENLKTGFLSGYYMYFREVYNDIALARISVGREYRAANFYFIREYCYGSMFRYNSAGEFNIPYGGISYNRKNFAQKIDALFSSDISSLFSRTDIHATDFERFMEEAKLTERDFVFLDPPYDTEFSSYDARSFDKNDQARLAAALRRIKAKFILIIKNTDFIYDLYKDNFNIASFDKNYTYNVRARNNQRAQHLIISNMAI